MNNEDNRGRMEHSCLISVHDSKPSVRPATGNPLFVVFLYISLFIKNISPFTPILISLCSKRCLSTECRFRFIEYRIAFPLSFYIQDVLSNCATFNYSLSLSRYRIVFREKVIVCQGGNKV